MKKSQLFLFNTSIKINQKLKTKLKTNHDFDNL